MKHKIVFLFLTKRFIFTLSEGATNASRMIMAYPDFRTPTAFVPGSRIEVSPDAYAVSHAVARRIRATGGGALYVDYGRDHPVPDSLRGIRDHGFVSPLSHPGSVDLSSDVDFSFLRSSCRDTARAHGPISQSEFLRSMGIGARMNVLLRSAGSRERRVELAKGFERLVGEGDGEMGAVYKVMCVVGEGDPVPYPFQTGRIGGSGAVEEGEK
ncbi:hypothetical protein HKX48_002588 [Thoreauomyces humboldtii]|nr:hypothetical protein HKX48_002588 [Thoreauomyces humboldtii]